MRPRERRETSEQDLFRSRLDQIIDMKHALVKLARAIDWGFLEQTFGAVYTDKPGQPPLPTRLMAGLAILKHTYDLSDEALCDRWVENPYFQYFCGEEFFQHALVFDRSSLTRWRQRMGEDKLKALLQESLAVATRTEAMKPSDLARVVIDTTVQPKAVMFPTDAKLLDRARERLVRLTKKLGVSLRQSYARVGTTTSLLGRPLRTPVTSRAALVPEFQGATHCALWITSKNFCRGLTVPSGGIRFASSIGTIVRSSAVVVGQRFERGVP